MLARPLPRGAVFIGPDDLMAVGRLRALSDAGLRPPGDAAVAGFDDVPSARLAPFGLMTIRRPMVELGRRAVERLTAIIDGDDADELTQIRPPELVVRHSTVGHTPVNT